MRILLASLALGAGLWAPARAANAGGEPFEFLLLDAGARPSALGGAYAAAGGDAHALFYNPAGLAWLPRHEAVFLHNKHFQDVHQDYGAVALRQGLALNFNYLRYPETQRTTYAQPLGTLGSFSSSDLSVAVGYGRRLGENVSVGAAFKYIGQTLDRQTSDNTAFDMGALWAVPAVPGLSAGLSLQNVGPDASFHKGSDGPREALPLNVRAGGAYRFTAFGAAHSFALDVAKERNSDAAVSAGFESVLAGALALRVGFASRNRAGVGMTGGVGWTYKDYSVDYAVVPYGILGFSHRASLTKRWGAVGETKSKGPSFGGWDNMLPHDELRWKARGRKRPAAVKKKAPAADTLDASELLARAERSLLGGHLKEARLDLDEAFAAFDEGDPRRLLYYERRGYIALSEGDLPAAKALYLEGLRAAVEMGASDSTVADIYAGLGLCLAGEKKGGGNEFLRKGRELKPSPRLQKLLERSAQAP